MKKRLFLFVLATIMSATYVMAEKFVAVKKNGVNLRAQPNTSSAVVGKAMKGTLFIVLGRSNGWTHVRDVVEGKEAYVSSALVMALEEYQTPNPEQQVVSFKEMEIGFEHKETGKKSELVSLWRFWLKKEGSKVVNACLSARYADTMGRSQTNENYYRGVIKPYCLVLTESTDYEGGEAEKLEEPIVIYESFFQETGIYVDGVFFIDQNSMEYGE